MPAEPLKISGERPMGQYKKIIEEILQLRQIMSEILGFENFAEYSLATKMAKKPSDVINFLNDLKKKAIKKSKNEILALQKYAKNKLDIKDLHPWDLAFVAEKYKEENFGVSQEELKKYFPVENVIMGLFKLVKDLYGIEVKQKKTKDVWHKDVRLYEIFDKDKKLRGKFYFDLYAKDSTSVVVLGWMNAYKDALNLMALFNHQWLL